MRLASIVRCVVLPCLVLVGVATPGASPPPAAQPATLAPHQRLLREIYQELIEINTTDSVGDNTTAAEEGGGHNGVAWLLANHRALIDADLAINEGGGGAIKNGVYLANSIQASEKIFQNYRLEVKNPGGHSSLPVKDNAISHLAGGLARLGEFDFPVRLDDISRAYFERTASTVPGALGDDMRALAGG